MEDSFPITGHRRQCDQLLQDIVKGRCAHSYLFCGARHLGKFTVARWFAGEILTRSIPEEEKEISILKIKKNMHPDCLILDQLWIDGLCSDWNLIARSSNMNQQHRAKAKVKTNTIGIDDVRVLQERLHETAQGEKTVCLIRSIERLNIAAANALLKILEEPPKHVLFCFTTESPGSVLPTIISRMRIMHFSPLSRREMAPLLNEFEEENHPLLLSIAQGSPGMLYRFLEDRSLLRVSHQAHVDALRFLESASALERFQQISSALGSSDEGASFFRHLFLHLNQKLRSDSVDESKKTAILIRSIFSLLRACESNTQKPLLAAHATFSLSSQ